MVEVTEEAAYSSTGYWKVSADTQYFGLYWLVLVGFGSKLSLQKNKTIYEYSRYCLETSNYYMINNIFHR